MIYIENLYVKYHKDFASLCDINLKIDDNENVILFGEPESGKSSLIRVLAKIQKPTSGSVTINKVDLAKVDYKKDISVGYLSGNGIFLDRKTVYDNIKYILKVRKVDKNQVDDIAENALQRYNLEAIKDTRVKMLSDYEKLVLSILRLSLRSLDLLLIDDIYFGLEDDEKTKIIGLIKELMGEKVTCVMAISDKAIANQFVGRVVKLNKGVIE